MYLFDRHLMPTNLLPANKAPLKPAVSTPRWMRQLGRLSLASCLPLLVGCQQATDKQNNAEERGNEVASAAAAAINQAKQLNLYASTNVWGSVAKAVGREKVRVISAVKDPTQDPHDYQASAQDKLDISRARLVLLNGGGYDDWTLSLAQAVGNKPVIINAVELSGLKANATTTAHHDHDKDHHDAHHHHGDFNEHVFFSLDTAKKVADAVANQLAAQDPTNKARYAQNATDFNQTIDQLKARANAVGAGKGLTAFATEPVTSYLLADLGIKDITPAGYTEQSETDAGVSVKVLNDSKNLLISKQVDLMVVNAQTEDATAKQLMATAQAAGIPIVQVNETFADGVTSYPDFINNTIDKFAKAVQSANKP